MGNQHSRKQQTLTGVIRNGDAGPYHGGTRSSVSPFRREKSIGGSRILDIPGKPGKAVVTLTNLQSKKSSGDCVTDSIYLDWKPPDNDGGCAIHAYAVEMYDLPTGNWIEVTQTQGPECRSMLDNILCGIMYRFRIRAVNEVGFSVPGIPSDAFVIDTPGVRIAPYFILCPPPEVERFRHQTAEFRAKALGTPPPNILWQKDEEAIFITQGIEITEEPDGSLLTVHNLQPEDNGLIQCIAVNHVGKATASSQLRVLCVPRFLTQSTGGGSTNSPVQGLSFTFSLEEMVRLKFPFESQPLPELTLHKDNMTVPEQSTRQLLIREKNVIFKIDSASTEDAGLYRIEADNGYGTTCIEFRVNIEVMPDPPGPPEILEVLPSGEISLSWDAPKGCRVDHYVVEYYRDQWQLWLRMKTCIDSSTVITDLIPGSKYKFRVMAVSATGMSEAGQESEEVMIGKMAEDELFDLPGPQRGRPMLKRTKKLPSFDRVSVDRIQSRAAIPPERRHTSLDREVYYDANNERKDVVTYKPPNIDKIGNLTTRYQLSNEELARYRMSMSQLCHKMKTISSSSMSKQGSKVSLETATRSLQLEVNHHARKSASMSQLSSAHIDRPAAPAAAPGGEAHQLLTAGPRFSSGQILQTQQDPGVSNLKSDVSECRKSLNDIRDRIGSLQSLLKTSRAVTGSKPSLFADLPKFTVPVLPSHTERHHSIRPEPIQSSSGEGQHPFWSQRSDSYANAIEDDPVVETAYKETHFPYNPDVVSLGSLECDKFPQEMQTLLSPGIEPKRSSLFLTECEDDEPTIEMSRWGAGVASRPPTIEVKMANLDLGTTGEGNQLMIPLTSTATTAGSSKSSRSSLSRMDSSPFQAAEDVRSVSSSMTLRGEDEEDEEDSSTTATHIPEDVTSLSSLTLKAGSSRGDVDRSGSACSQGTLLASEDTLSLDEEFNPDSLL